MAILYKDDVSSPQRLLPWHTVGRHPDAHLRLAEPSVSGSHAAFRWTSEGWQVRDLGSRNGTFIGDRQLESGESAMLTVGMRIGFGAPEPSWQVRDLGAPTAYAVSVSGGADCTSEGDMIALPSWEDVEVLVYRDAAGAWWRESDDVVLACVSGEQVDTASGSWRVELPAPVASTAASGDMNLDLATAALDFEVSQDEETVGLSLVWPNKRLDLGHRAQHYTLLLLARHRNDEASGWLHPDALCAMQRCRLRLLNLHVHRTRKSLAEHSIRGAGGIVERRPGTRELRLGITDVSIRMMED